MLKERTDVLVIGAGPAGLSLSIALAQAGVDHLLIDRLEQEQNTSRAGVIHAQTLETLDRIGVTRRMTELGLKLDRFAIRDRDHALLSLRFGELPSRHPYLLMLPQNVTEAVLAERLAELGGGVLRGVTATAVEQDSDGARVTVIENGRERTIAARYVVGADGMRSMVRQATGIDFDGAAYEESFVLADVHLDWPLGRSEVSLFFSPAGLVVVAPLPDGSYRVVATMENAPETPSVADIQALIDARGPKSGRARVLDLTWSSRFRLHHRLARGYRQGRLFLVGDAAHVHSPAGGQGMNTGIVDGVVLGELLADVIRGVRAESELDVYEGLRREAAKEVLDLAGTMTRMALIRNPLRRALRNLALSVVNRIPAARRRIQMKLSGLSRARLAELPKPERQGNVVAMPERPFKRAA